MSRSLRIVLVGSFSIGTGLLVAAALSIVEAVTGVALYGVTAALVVPVGAIGCGLLVALGFREASRTLHLRPQGAALAVPLVTALVAYVATHWFAYMRAVVPPALSFLDYLQLVATESYVVFDDAAGGGGSRLGSWGYAIVALQILGFAGGSWIITHGLDRTPWCESCERFLDRTGRRQSFFTDAAHFETTAHHLVDLVEHRAWDEAFVRTPDEKASLKTKRQARLHLQSEQYSCPTCGCRHTIVATKHRVGNNWQLLSETDRQPPAASTQGQLVN